MLKQFRSQLDRLRAKREAIFDTDRQTRINNVLHFYTKIVARVVGAERSSIFINDPTQQKVWLKAGTGVEERDIEVPRTGSIVGKVIETGEPVVVSNMHQQDGAHKETDAQTGFVTREIACVPVKAVQENEPIGAIEVINKINGKEFGREDVEMLQEIADYLSTEVNSVFLDQEIFGLSEKIYNGARRTIAILIGGIIAAVVLLLVVLLIDFLVTMGG